MISLLARLVLARKSRLVLEFHGISARKHPGIPAGVRPYLSRRDLQAILTWAHKRFRFLSPAEYFSGDQPGLLLTFDDGFANQFANALPVLEEFDAPAIFFVPVQQVTPPKDWLPFAREAARRHWLSETEVPEELAADFYDGLGPDALQACAQHPLLTIGSHSMTHPLLTRCAPDELEWEVNASRRLLEAFTGKPIEYFAYPAGDYNRPVAEAVRRAGYRAAFAEDSRGVGLPAYEIPRVGIYAADPLYLGLKLSGLRWPALRAPILPAP